MSERTSEAGVETSVGDACGSFIPILYVSPSERTLSIFSESPTYIQGWTEVFGRKGRRDKGLPLNPVSTCVIPAYRFEDAPPIRMNPATGPAGVVSFNRRRECTDAGRVSTDESCIALPRMRSRR